ncbi:uncharacterized protein LOC133314208 [Gastrolobium bilobum]|uniref:uncharacterized protein LOC133314208 n=1 Tax=Gastrolobium bilobum TaxID=150636 RepID=UPI002AB0E01A|nr:uncharacterized protein LOC133314208 [Gastrolobium bilobum]
MATTSHSNHKYTNRLASEQSPYLLQHAHNPVDWYPWGEEAFAETRKRDALIFLSSGYNTCHWYVCMTGNPYLKELKEDGKMYIKAVV